MSLYDRMGSGGYQRPSPLRGFRFFPPVIKWLLVSNSVIWLLADFLLPVFTFQGVSLGRFVWYYFALYPVGEPNFLPWQIITYMFLHGGFVHLLVNMFVLWMFGMELENIWGSKKFLIYYLLCGIGGGVGNLLVAPLLGQVAPTVGASGAIFGVLVAFGMMFPNRPIYLYFLFPIPAKYFVLGYMVMELSVGVFGTSDGIAHFAHLGGAAVGLLYMLSSMGVLPFHSFWSRFAGDLKNPFGKTETYRWKNGKKAEVRDAKFYDIKTGKRKNDSEQKVSQEMIDSILDKIGSGGYQSLTEDEKRILNEASRRMN